MVDPWRICWIKWNFPSSCPQINSRRSWNSLQTWRTSWDWSGQLWKICTQNNLFRLSSRWELSSEESKWQLNTAGPIFIIGWDLVIERKVESSRDLSLSKVPWGRRIYVSSGCLEVIMIGMKYDNIKSLIIKEVDFFIVFDDPVFDWKWIHERRIAFLHLFYSFAVALGFEIFSYFLRTL